jgi:hypothetical protein
VLWKSQDAHRMVVDGREVERQVRVVAAAVGELAEHLHSRARVSSAGEIPRAAPPVLSGHAASHPPY